MEDNNTILNNIQQNAITNKHNKQLNQTRYNKDRDPEAIKKTAAEYEEVFLIEMLNSMFKDISMDPLVADKGAGRIYKSMMIEQYGKQIAENGKLGIAQHLEKEMLKLQEAIDHETAILDPKD